MKGAIRRVLTSKYFLIPTVALLLYTLIGFVFAPFIVRWVVPRYAQKNLQCQASLEKVRINPFALTFEARGFSLSLADGSPLAAFERLFVDFEMNSLFHWAAIFREFSLDKPALHVVFEPDGGINLQKLAPGSPEPKEPKKTDSKPFPILLQNIAIHGGTVEIIDRRQSEPADLKLELFDLNLKDLSTLQDHHGGTYFFTAGTPEGEKIEWQGKLTLAPLSTSGKLTLSGIKTASLWKFVRDSVNLEPPKGTVDVTTDYQLDARTTPAQMMLEGLRVGLSDLSLKLLESDKPFLELNKIELDAPRLDLAAKTLQGAKLLVEGGAVDVRIDQAGRTNLQRIMRAVPRKQNQQGQPPAPEAAPGPAPQAAPPGAEATPGSAPEAAPPAPAASPFKVEAGAIEFKGIAVALDDLSRTNPLKAAISNINLHLTANIEAGSKDNKVSLKEISSELSAVQVGSSQAPEPLFQTEKLIVEGGECDLGAHALTVARIALSNGHVDVSRDREGQLNWVQLLATRDAPPEGSGSKPAAGSGPPWKFLLKSFEVDGFRSKLADLAKLPDKPLFNLQGFNIKVTDIDGKSPMGFSVGFQVQEGGSANISGKADPSAPSVEAEVKATGLVLTPLQPYLEPFITLILRSAAVSAGGKLRYGVAGSTAKLAYEGGFSLNKLNLTEANSQETYLGFDALQIPQLKLTLEPNGFETKEIILNKLVGALIIAEDRSVNLVKVVKEGGVKEKTSVPSKPASKASQDAFPFHIGKVRVENGNTVFADLSLRPKFMTRIHELKGTISGLSSAKDTVTKIQLDGKVDQYGSAKINGVMRLYDFKRSADIDMVFRNVEMTNLSPYSGKFAGRQIKSGKLSTDLKYKIQDGQLVGDNKIIVDNLLLGERVDSPNAVNLPLDLAIALLKDSNGRIDIGLPVSGDLNNPQFSIGPLVWKAITSLLTKVVTAPFRALGGLLGGEDAKFDAVEFEAGSAGVAPPEQEKLKKLTEALQKRPELRLVVQGRYSTEADGLEFKDLSVRRAVLARMGAKPGPEEDPGPLDFTDSKTRDTLEDLYKERFGKSALDELEEGIKKGTIKPRTPANQQEEKSKRKKAGRFSKMMGGLKLYKLVPGKKSPEQAAAWAGELYVRLVESEPVSAETLVQLAQHRAQAIVKELESSGGIGGERVSIKDPEAQTGDEAPSARLSLDVR